MSSTLLLQMEDDQWCTAIPRKSALSQVVPRHISINEVEEFQREIENRVDNRDMILGQYICI